MKRKNLGRAVLVLFLLLPALAVWWPLWFMGTGALMPLDELRAALGPVLQGAEGSAFWPLLPSWPTLQPLAELLLDTPQFFTMFWNTCAIVFPQVLGQVLVGAPAAWAFSRLRFRGRRALFTLYIVLMLMPFQVTMVSGYLVADAMGIMDTFWAIILPGAFSTFPVFIMAKGFDAVPIALLEAASIDGAGPLRTFFHIGVPLGVPGILSAAVLGFLEAWNAIEQPMTFLKTKALWPLSLYLPQIAAENDGVLKAGSAGTVETLTLEPGGTVTEAPVAALAPADAGMTATFTLDSGKAEKLAVGAALTLRQGGMAVSTTVRAISAPDENGRVTVTADVPADAGLRKTQPVTASAELSRTTYEMVLPPEAVRMDNKGSYVLRVEQTQTILGLRNVLSRVDVTVLEQSASGVAVEGPLSPQDVLVKSSARPVAAGDSVRVEQP